MIRHVVNFKLSEKLKDTEKKDALDKLKSMLDNLPAQIPEILYFQTGKNISGSTNAFDLVLISDFKSLETLNIYRKHEEHVKVLDYIKLVVDKLVVVDFES